MASVRALLSASITPVLSYFRMVRMMQLAKPLLSDICVRYLGSVFISGSNPNPDYTVGPNVKYPTEYRTERFYPWYYTATRPQPSGLISQIGYGGSFFDVTLTKADLQGNAANANLTKAVIIRTGFSTHGLVSKFRVSVLTLRVLTRIMKNANTRAWAKDILSWKHHTVLTRTNQ